MSFDYEAELLGDLASLNPFGTGQCLPTWLSPLEQIPCCSLNPFGTGQCLPTNSRLNTTETNACLNPFGTGQCLPTQTITLGENPIECLNPFGTGQCLPTPKDYRYRYSWKVSIPLEQGSVFRHYIRNEDNNRRLSQSLWNRAVSSDLPR